MIDPDVDDHERAAELGRRRAKALVSEAFRAVGSEVDSLGLRFKLPIGIWCAAIGTLLACLDREDVVTLLGDRSSVLSGPDGNSTSPQRTRTDSASAEHVQQAATVAKVVMRSLEDALEALDDEDLEDFYPEAVLDVTLQVLVPAWGVTHTRRALSEQVSLIFKGDEAPLNFDEPTDLCTPPQRKAPPSAARLAVVPTTDASVAKAPNDQKIEVAVSPPITVPEPSSVALKVAPRLGPPRRVSAFVSRWADDRGTSAWAVSLSGRDDDGRVDNLDAGGLLIDPGGRQTALLGLRECLTAACRNTARASVTIETPCAFLVDGFSGPDRGFHRRDGEDEDWAAVDEFARSHEVRIKLVTTSLDRDLAERCDRMQRELLER